MGWGWPSLVGLFPGSIDFSSAQTLKHILVLSFFIIDHLTPWASHRLFFHFRVFLTASFRVLRPFFTLNFSKKIGRDFSFRIKFNRERRVPAHFPIAKWKISQFFYNEKKTTKRSKGDRAVEWWRHHSLRKLPWFFFIMKMTWGRNVTVQTMSGFTGWYPFCFNVRFQLSKSHSKKSRQLPTNPLLKGFTSAPPSSWKCP